LISAPHLEVNTYFESDFVLVCAFLIIAWTISFYVRMERSHIDSLKGLVNLDGLTGLYNHRYFYESLKREMKEAKENDTDLSLLFLDIDYFKNYNDINGHQRGDEVLKVLAKLLLGNVREQDIVSRYGGEEFSVVLPGVSEQEALQVAERLRQVVQEQHFPGQEYMPAGNLTISIGVASISGNIKINVDDIVKSADEALYKAKFLRKNRVERYYSILDDLQNSVGNDDKEIIISIKTLIAVIDAKDKYTFGHVERVVSYCLLMAEQLEFDEQTKKNLIYAAYMHDIGKINIPEEILVKNTNLTLEEWEILKAHPHNGVEIIKNVAELKEVVPIILQHHEKYDGTGYPKQLKGEEISYLARVLTVVDCFDAMTSDRPYQQKKTIFEAFDELIRCSGTHFDPEVVQAFIRTVVEKMEGIK
jgi:diguanylate cyclase (GGDEF)-like protein/putative nucleotidyltransferase with HDIG domain